MRFDAEAQQWPGDYEAYGVEVNAIAADRLFAEYERCGFLYPAKRERLRGVWPDVVDTWRRTLTEASRQRAVHHCVTYGDADAATPWAAGSFWRSTHSRCHCQHLVGRGGTTGARAVMLATQDAMRTVGADSCENWYRAENRFPMRVFGSVPAALGHDRAAIETRELLLASPGFMAGRPSPAGISVHRVHDADAMTAHDFLARLAGPVIARAEELLDGDIELRSLDEDYRALGLQRCRHVAMARSADAPVAVAIAWRGPVGLNFSLLENRCDLWMDPEIDVATRRGAAHALIAELSPAYNDAGLGGVLLACDPASSEPLMRSPALEHIRSYQRCVWLRKGFRDWARHVDSFYQKAEARRAARAARRPTAEVKA